jgi:hypothetical protein
MILKEIGFQTSAIDPCLFSRKNKFGRIILVVHIDDCYVFGDQLAIDQLTKELLEKGLKSKLSTPATDYLSREIKINKQKTWIGQPTLMKKMLKKFGPSLQQMGNYNYKTLGTPGFLFSKPLQHVPILSDEQQKSTDPVWELFYNFPTKPDRILTMQFESYPRVWIKQLLQQ